jgi:hypothetical protein
MSCTSFHATSSLPLAAKKLAGYSHEYKACCEGNSANKVDDTLHQATWKCRATGSCLGCTYQLQFCCSQSARSANHDFSFFPESMRLAERVCSATCTGTNSADQEFSSNTAVEPLHQLGEHRFCAMAKEWRDPECKRTCSLKGHSTTSPKATSCAKNQPSPFEPNPACGKRHDCALAASRGLGGLKGALAMQ